MNAVDRFFFPATLAACATLFALAAAEPVRVADAKAQQQHAIAAQAAVAAAPVVQLERVVITASRLEAPRQLAATSAAAATDTTAVR